MIAQRTTWPDSNRLRFSIPMIANREIGPIRQRVRQLIPARRLWHDECEENHLPEQPVHQSAVPHRTAPIWDGNTMTNLLDSF